MSVRYVIPVEVILPEYPVDDGAQGDELELVEGILHDAVQEVDLAGVRVRVLDSEYGGRVREG